MNPPFFLFIVIPIKMKQQNPFKVMEVSRQNNLLPMICMGRQIRHRR